MSLFNANSYLNNNKSIFNQSLNNTNLSSSNNLLNNNSGGRHSLFGSNVPSNTIFGAFNPSNSNSNSSNAGIFGNNNIQPSISNSGNSFLGSFSNQQTGYSLQNKSIFGIGSNSSNVNVNKGIFSSMNNQSTLANKSIFGTSLNNTPNSSNLGGSLYGNTNNQANVSMKSFFHSSQMGTQGTNMGMKSVFGSVPQSTQNTSSGGLFGSSQNQSTGSLFGSAPSNQNKPSGSIFGQVPSSSKNSGGLFGSSGTNIQNKSINTLFGTYPLSNQSNTNNTFGSSATNQSKPTNSFFGGTSSQGGTLGSTGAFGSTSNDMKPSLGSPFGQLGASNQNTSSGSLFGSTQNQSTGGLFGSAPSNQNKPSGSIFGQVPSSNQTSGGLFGNAGTNMQNKSINTLFGTYTLSNQSNANNTFGSSTTNESKPTSSFFGGTSSQGGTLGNTGAFGNAGNQMKTPGGSPFGQLSTSNQNTSTGGLFGSSPNQGAGSIFGNTNSQNTSMGGSSFFKSTNQSSTLGTPFGQTSSSQNTTTNSLFGSPSMNQSSGGIFGTTQPQNSNQTTNTGGIFGSLSSSQSKPTNIFGLPSTNQTSTGSLFGSSPATANDNQTSMNNRSIFGTSSGMQNMGNTGTGTNTMGTTSGSLFGAGIGSSLGGTSGTSAFGTSTKPGIGTGFGTSGLGSSGLGTSGFGTSGFGISDLGKPGLGTSGFGTSGMGTTSGFGTSGFGTSGVGTSGLETSGLGTSVLGTSGLGSSGLGSSGFGTSGLGTSGLGTSGTGTSIFGTTTTSTPGFKTAGTSGSIFGTTSTTTPGFGTTGTSGSIFGTSGTSTSGFGTSGMGTSGIGTSAFGTSGTATGTSAPTPGTSGFGSGIGTSTSFGSNIVSSLGVSGGTSITGSSGNVLGIGSTATTVGASSSTGGTSTIGSSLGTGFGSTLGASSGTSFGTSTITGLGSSAGSGLGTSFGASLRQGTGSAATTTTTDAATGATTTATNMSASPFGAIVTTTVMPSGTTSTTTPLSTTSTSTPLITITGTTSGTGLLTTDLTLGNIGTVPGATSGETINAFAGTTVGSVIGAVTDISAGVSDPKSMTFGLHSAEAVLDKSKLINEFSIKHGGSELISRSRLKGALGLIGSLNPKESNVADLRRKFTTFDDDLKIVKRKEHIFTKLYGDQMSLEKSIDKTVYSYLNIIISDNINNMQKDAFSTLNSHDSYIWENLKSTIFDDFTECVEDSQSKEAIKLIEPIKTIAFDQHELQILTWLYTTNDYKIDFMPFKSFYSILLEPTNLNYCNVYKDEAEKKLHFKDYIEVNDHYYMNWKSQFLISQLCGVDEKHIKGKGEMDYIDDHTEINGRKGGKNKSNNSTNQHSESNEETANTGDVDVNGLYTQTEKDILNSLLNTSLSITKENVKRKHSVEYFDEESETDWSDEAHEYKEHVYENLLLNYLFGTLQHIHERFYKIEICNYVSKNLNKSEDFFHDTKSNITFAYCFNNFYENNMDEDNSTIHFCFYLINILFRSGNYVGLIQLVTNEELGIYLHIEDELKDFIILLIRILLIIYNRYNEMDLIDEMDLDVDCGDIYRKKITSSKIVNYLYSINSVCNMNVYAYDLLCILFADIFYIKGNSYTNREKKIERKNILDYLEKKTNMDDKRHTKNMNHGNKNDNCKSMDVNNGSCTSRSNSVSDSSNNNNNNNNKSLNGERVKNYGDTLKGNVVKDQSSSSHDNNNNNNNNDNNKYNNNDNNNNNNINNKNNNILGGMDNDRNWEKKEKGKENSFELEKNKEVLNKSNWTEKDTYMNGRSNEIPGFFDELEQITKELLKSESKEQLDITTRFDYKIENCNIETSIWLELSFFIRKNFDIFGYKYQDNFDILNANLGPHQVDEYSLNTMCNDTKARRKAVNDKVEKLFIGISSFIISENEKHLFICSQLKMNEVVNNFFVYNGDVAKSRRKKIAKIIKNNFFIYIKLFYYLLLVGNLFTSVIYLSCVSVKLQKILILLSLFLHQSNVISTERLNAIKKNTIKLLKFINESKFSDENALKHLKDIDLSNKDNVLNICTLNTELSWEHLLLKNDNMNVMVKLAYLLNVKSSISAHLIKQAVEENQDLLLNDIIIGRIYNNGNILYGKLFDFLFLYKNKTNVKGDNHCMCLMFNVLNSMKYEYKQAFKSNKIKFFNSTNDLYWKYKNFRFIDKDDINTLDNLFLNDNVINTHSSVLYKLSHLYSCLAYCANQKNNFILSFTCFYIIKNETAAINALLNIYTDEYIYFYHNEAPEYKYIRKCAFCFYHLAKNMWPSNEKLGEIENKAHLILVILFMKKNMFDEAFNIFYTANLIEDHSLQKSSVDAYFFIDLISCYLMTLEEMCKKIKISELVTKRKLDTMVNVLLPIKDRLHGQVIGSMNYLSSQQF